MNESENAACCRLPARSASSTERASERVHARAHPCPRPPGHASPRPRPAPLRLGEGARAIQPLGAARVTGLKDVRVGELAVGGRGEIAQSVALRRASGTQQRVRCLLVTPTGGVDERRTECEPGLRLELGRAARVRPGRRASERPNPASKLPALTPTARLRHGPGRALPAGGSRAGGRDRLRCAKRAAPGSLPCSARNSCTQPETCRFAPARSPASEWLRTSSSWKFSS